MNDLQTASRPTAVVLRNLEAHRRGDVAGWRAGWHDDAVWRFTGTTAFAGDLAVDDYVELIRATTGEGSGYHGEPVGVLEIGELVVVSWHSAGSVAGVDLDGEGGLLIYRVVDGKVAEGWAIAAGSRGTLPF